MSNCYRIAGARMGMAALLVALGACGTVPVPARPAGAKSPAAVVHGKPAVGEPAAVAPPAPSVGPSPGVAPAAAPPAPVPTAKEEAPAADFYKGHKTFPNARGYWLDAIGHLEQGERDEARWALTEALRLEPDNKQVQKLLHQTDANAKAELGEESFDYTVQPGDTLSKIAKQYMGDPLSFYFLAKYNDIDNPSQVHTGQVIKIPGKKPASEVVQEAPVAAPASGLVTKARELHTEGKHKAVIELLENQIDGADSEPLRALLVGSYRKVAESLRKEGKLAEARGLLQKAAALEPGNREIGRELAATNKAGEVERHYQAGLDALQKKEFDTANKEFTKTLEMQPDHAGAKSKREAMKKDVVEDYYKQALAAQRKQELDKAIELWDSVLALDPSNENAKLHRLKAVELKDKLKKFGK